MSLCEKHKKVGMPLEPNCTVCDALVWEIKDCKDCSKDARIEVVTYPGMFENNLCARHSRVNKNI